APPLLPPLSRISAGLIDSGPAEAEYGAVRQIMPIPLEPRLRLFARAILSASDMERNGRDRRHERAGERGATAAVGPAQCRGPQEIEDERAHELRRCT